MTHNKYKYRKSVYVMMTSILVFNKFKKNKKSLSRDMNV